MSKPSVAKNLIPAVGIVVIAIVAALAVVGSGRMTPRSVSGQRMMASASLASAPASGLSAGQRGRMRANLDALSLAFEANQGQTDPQVKYLARGNGYTVFLTGNDTVFSLQSPSQLASQTAGKRGFGLAKTTPGPRKTELSAAIHMHLVGGNAEPQIAAGSQLPGVTNYYIGSDRSQWQTGVKQFAGVSYRDVYPGVNMAFHGEQRQLEFDFIVAPGASPAPIQLGFSGARWITTDGSGNLLLASAAGNVVLHKPVAYQEIDGKRQNVAAEFVEESNNRVTFALGNYDHSRELVIDPSLSYATYLGGSAEDEAFAIAVDGSGKTYITGQTSSPSFNGKPAGPTLNVFVTRLNSSGTSFDYTDIFEATGGSGNCSASGTGACSGNAIAVDGSGNVYVAGSATAGFPTLLAYKAAYGGGSSDAFVLKLNASGALVYSTYLGGSGQDIANGVAVDGSGNIYVAGTTASANFPTAGTPIQSSNKGQGDAFVSKLDSTGTTLSYSTYLGGTQGDIATGIALDSSNNIYVAGSTESTDFPTTTGAFQTTAGGSGDAFVTEIKADGTEGYSTYLGGSGTDNGFDIAVDAAGEAYVTGNTASANFPTANPAQATLAGSSSENAFVSKLNAGGSLLLFSTYYGGTQADSATAIALDSFGDAYITGQTTSSNFPVSNAFQQSLSGTSDAFVTEFSNTGFVVYSSYLGGTGVEDSLSGATGSGSAVGGIAVDSSSNAYLAGETSSTTGFPASGGQTSYGGGDADGFVAKVAAAPADFSVAVSPTTISTASGQTTSGVTVTVSSVNSSYGQAVALSCGTVPSHAACHFTSASVTPGSTAQTSTLTISTNGSASSSLRAPNTNGMGMFYAMFLPIGGIALLGAGISSHRKRLFGFLLLGVILMGLLMLPACGGGGNGGGGGGGTNTPAGTYSITVSGQGGGATHSATLKLTVN